MQAKSQPTWSDGSALAPGERYPVSPGDLVRGKYKIERILAIGAMTVIAVATVEAIEREGPPSLPRPGSLPPRPSAPAEPGRVALKVMREARVTPESTTRFMADAKKLAGLRSPHVAKVLDVGMLVAGVPYLVMELLEGSDLETVLERSGALSTPVAVDYVLQACDALAEAERIGVLHRDLKPADLFLTHRDDGTPVIKVLGLGIPKGALPSPAGAETEPTRVLGALQYKSPEQIRAVRDGTSEAIDGKSDVWALGAILFELLAGHGPFAADASEETIGKILDRPTPSLALYASNVSPSLAAAVARALEKDRSKRFVAVGVFAMELREVEVSPSVANVPSWSQAPPDPPPPTTTSRSAVPSVALVPEPRPRRSFVPFFLVLVTLATTGGVGSLVMRYRKPPVPAAVATVSAPASASAPPSAPSASLPVGSTTTPAAVVEPPPSAAASASEPRQKKKKRPKPKPSATVGEDLPAHL